MVVVGGGCYGSYYVRQLGRARRANALDYRRVLVVDRDPECRVARDVLGAGGPPHRDDTFGFPFVHHPESAVSIITAQWRDFFAAYLGAAADGALEVADDAIVPSPLMPHLMYDWLRDRAAARWPERRAMTRPLHAPPPTPWQRAAADGGHFVSFAEWTCPINCVEPARCPATRGPRDWSMPPMVRDYVAQERASGRPIVGPAVLHCTHRAYGVGMFDTRDVVAADALARDAGERSDSFELLVATVSHCHGAMNLLRVER